MQEKDKAVETNAEAPLPVSNKINDIKNLIEKDQTLAKNMLAKLSGTEKDKPADQSTEYDYLDNIAKPSWIENVKKIQKNIITPDVKKKELPEKVKVNKEISHNGMTKDKENGLVKEEYKEYPFFTIIKRIMYANGDMRAVKDESALEVHKFVSKAVNIIFDKQLLNKYFEPEKKSERAGDKTQRHKALKLKKLLSKLYSQEYFKFFQFNKIAKNVEKLDYDLEKDTEVVDESKLFNYESDNDSDDGLSFKLINCNIRDEEKANFNHQRMEKMQEEEYLEFVACRSTNFLSDGKDKLINFLDLENRGLGFLSRNKNMIEFIAYILCRIVGNTVENIIRHVNHGILKVLDHPLDTDEIGIEADKHLTFLKFQTKKVIRDSLSIEEIAFRLFLKESKERSQTDGAPGPSLTKQLKLEDKSVTTTDEANQSLKQQEQKQALKTVWKKLGATVRKQWCDRVIAEKQIKELLENHPKEEIKWEDIDPINSYAEYLINSLRDVKNKSQISDQVFIELFRRFQNNETSHVATNIASEIQKGTLINQTDTIVSDNSQQDKIQKSDAIKPINRKRRLESLFE